MDVGDRPDPGVGAGTVLREDGESLDDIGHARRRPRRAVGFLPSGVGTNSAGPVGVPMASVGVAVTAP
jgi:hypothetical protein